MKKVDISKEIAFGNLIKYHRITRGRSQSDLAAQLDISVQQLQKYETGINRISALKLKIIAERLEVPITVFFDKIDQYEYITTFSEQDYKILKNIKSIGSIEFEKTLDNLVDIISNICNRSKLNSEGNSYV